MQNSEDNFAHECMIRDAFRDHLGSLRPSEMLYGTEVNYPGSRRRADMRTIDERNLIREWEFKIKAGLSVLGQVLNYLRLARESYGFSAPVRGVIAAFEFEADLVRTNEVCNLNIELVQIPRWLRAGGQVPAPSEIFPGLDLPQIAIT